MGGNGGRAKPNVQFVGLVKKISCGGFFYFLFSVVVCVVFRLAVADNVLGVWRSGFYLEAEPVNLIQNYLLKAKLANLHD